MAELTKAQAAAAREITKITSEFAARIEAKRGYYSSAGRFSLVGYWLSCIVSNTRMDGMHVQAPTYPLKKLVCQFERLPTGSMSS
jgi:hypothetical protein